MSTNDFKKLLDEALEPIKQKQESQSAALVSIESKLDAYGDMYKINEDHIKRLDKRLNTVEDNLGIRPHKSWLYLKNRVLRAIFCTAISCTYLFSNLYT